MYEKESFRKNLTSPETAGEWPVNARKIYTYSRFWLSRLLAYSKRRKFFALKNVGNLDIKRQLRISLPMSISQSVDAAFCLR